jgi:2-dehydro-3-deoxygluconokinase
MGKLVTFGETPLMLWPPGHERLETADRMRVAPAGTESNVAIAASRQGIETTWLSMMGDTPLGRKAISTLQGQDVDVRVTWTDEHRQSLVFYERGKAPRVDTTYDDLQGAAIELAKPKDLEMGAVQDAACLFISSRTIGLSDQLADTAEALFRACSGKTALGLDFDADRWSAADARETLSEIFPTVDVLVANEQHAKTVLGKSGSPTELAHTVASEWDFDVVAITRSEHGALVWHNATIHDRDGVETELVDKRGQHDAFTGTFLAHWLDDRGISDAVAAGVAAASLTRTIPGPLPTVTEAEIDDLTDRKDSSGGR